MRSMARLCSTAGPALWLGLAFYPLIALPAAAATGPWVENEQARVRLVAARSARGPAGSSAGSAATIDLGLEFELETGWHVYWSNSGDAGYPPRLDLSRTPALAGARLLFPAPHRFDLPGGLVSFGYEDHVLYPIAPGFEVPADGEGPLAPVLARLDYLVCREECIPYTAELTLDLEAARRRDGPEGVATRARLAATRASLPAGPGAIAGAPQVTLRVEPGPASSLVLVFATSGGALRAAGPDLFFEVHPLFALDRPQFTAAADGLRFRVPFRALDETRPLPATTTFAWTLTGLERDAGAAADSSSGALGVALAGSATVEIPHLRNSESPPGAGRPSNLWMGVALLAGVLALFLLLRSRRSR
ncbi:MAG: protein-disulfide reductase DsbD domain-containing protein [Thermoanaerobaculia bacterium]